MTNTVSKNNFGTLLLQLQQWQPCEWQDQAKQIYHSMVAGVELEKHATGHEMLNQQSEQLSFLNTAQNWFAFAKLVATYNFTASLFCTAKSVFKERQLVADPKLWFLHSCFCCRDLGSFASNDKHSLEEQFWHLAFATSTVATLRVARLGWFPSQATTVWFVSLHWTGVPGPMRCQINNQKSSASQTQHKTGLHSENWWLPTTSQLHIFVAHNLHLGLI